MATVRTCDVHPDRPATGPVWHVEGVEVDLCAEDTAFMESAVAVGRIPPKRGRIQVREPLEDDTPPRGIHVLNPIEDGPPPGTARAERVRREGKKS